ncbi:thioredoxin fold domain-containing protein [Thalassococcus sp. BH17M4-6]|uniref:thioredoxin fold domain-containing protein n=1 Tax=Thalassococcus sp. BH17M4-6 TaxID=3413148 RepID=UPI003BDBA80A
MQRPLPLIAAALWLLSTGPLLADPQLVMVEQPGCVYCERWDEEISEAYPKTREGQHAPLLRADLRTGPPDGIEYDRRVNFTPTFILVEDGTELARIEGYPGADFFWGVLSMMLAEHTDYAPDVQSATPVASEDKG